MTGERARANRRTAADMMDAMTADSRAGSSDVVLGRVLVDESHRQAWSIDPTTAARMNPENPADAAYVVAADTLRDAGYTVNRHAHGALTAEGLAAVDLLVLPHCADDDWESTTGYGTPRYTDDEIDAIERFVRAGGGLMVLGETEQPKYGNNLADITARFGVGIGNATVQDPVENFREVATWPLISPVRDSRWDPWASVSSAAVYRSGVVQPAGPHVTVVGTSSTNARPHDVPLIAAALADHGRVIVLADSDVFGDDSINDLDNRQLWLNLATWTLAGPDQTAEAPVDEVDVTPDAWVSLESAIEELRPLLATNGALAEDADSRTASDLITRIAEAVSALAPAFPHQAEQLRATVTDLQTWRDNGIGVPDFLDSLLLFHPEEHRQDGVLSLAVFPMYTQNGNPHRHLEAVITRTVWPDWIAALEAGDYDNAAFVPIEFVRFTAGYDTHSAVLFPETVAVRETPAFTWGGIFCDREAARFRTVSRAASEILGLSLPPDAEMLLNDQDLAQQTFVLWDLVHDRTHSHGDLPFDPFMIKQRMPYWMYSLEELRCDLNTYKETAELERRGVVLARHVRIAILFDRLFRFPTTGERVRNYDGLGGQLLFAWLHRQGVLNWTDNTLTIDWADVDASVVALTDEVNALYRDGIDRSRIGHWVAAHEFVSGLVPPHPASQWAQGPQSLPNENKAAVDAVLPDEFPLNVFYEALRKKLADTIESTRGMTGADR